MPNGNPTFGDNLPVTVLDIGQEGGTRHEASDAFATVEVVENPDQVAQVKQGFPQQNVNAVDILGTRGKLVIWRGSIRAKTPTELQTIESEIEQKKSGRYRDPATGLVTIDMDQVKPTLLQRDSLAGGEESNLIQSPSSATLKEYRRIGGRKRITGWASEQTIAVVQGVEIVFEILGDTEAPE